MNKHIQTYNTTYGEYRQKQEAIENNINRIKLRIAQDEAMISRLEAKRFKLDCPKWTDTLKEIGKELEQLTGLVCEAGNGVFGMRCETHLILKEGEGWKYYLVITPAESNGVFALRYDIIEKNEPHNFTINDLNHFYRKTAPLPDTAEEILEVMKAQSERINHTAD